MASAGRLTIVGLSATIIVSGGIIAGWPTNLRLASPYRVKVDGTAIDPPGTAAAIWSRTAIGPDNRIGAETSDARLLQTDARQVAVSGVFPDIDDVLHTAALESWQTDLLRREQLRYLMVDKREVSGDVLAGYFFGADNAPSGKERAADITEKFERVPWADRVFDSGTIVLYDIQRLINEQPAP